MNSNIYITIYNVPLHSLDKLKYKLSRIIDSYRISDDLDKSTSRSYLKIQNIDKDDNENNIIQELISNDINIFKPRKKKIFNQNSNLTYDLQVEISAENNLLIVGNGFDVEHSLKTHYSDFFDTINNRVSSKNEIILNNNKYLIEDNHLLLYLLEEYKQNKLQGNNWIDIETKLKDIIIFVEEINTHHFLIKEYRPNIDYIKNEYFKLNELDDKANILFPDKLKNHFSPIWIDPFNTIFYSNERYIEIINNLENNLYILTNMLRDYLLEQNISAIEKTKDISDIDYKITHVLSFNYTDTFRQLYSDIDNNKIDFIHGSLNKNNLVLGINETLTEDTENKIVDTVYFKKYFQRIYKKTDYQYVSWLDSTDSQNYADFDTVYIHGHSLDESDKKILEKIINSVLKKDTSTVKIFYYDEKHYRQEVTNLIKVLGKDVFQKYYFQNRIIFIKQTPKK